MKNHPLEGSIAIIRIDNPEIPAMLQGSIDTITSVQKSRNATYLDLELDHKSYAAVEARDVLVFKPVAEINKSLSRKKKDLTRPEIAEITRVIKLIELKEKYSAFNLAVKNKTLSALCLTTASHYLELLKAQRLQNKGKKI